MRLTRAARRGEVALRPSPRLDRRDGSMTVAGVGEPGGEHDPGEPVASAGCDQRLSLHGESRDRALRESGLEHAGARNERVIGADRS